MLQDISSKLTVKNSINTKTNLQVIAIDEGDLIELFQMETKSRKKRNEV